MESTNDPYSSDAAYAHDDVDPEALALSRFELTEAARDHEPAHLGRETPRTDPERSGEAATGTAEVSAVARHGDPSVSTQSRRRARLEHQVRDRRGVRWVPATELMHQGTAKLAGHSMRLQTWTHRAARDAAVRAVMRGGAVTSQSLRRLGSARPLRNGSDSPATRPAVAL